MKKFISMLFVAIIAFSMFSFPVTAVENKFRVTDEDCAKQLDDFLEKNISRTVGTDGEKQAASYIANLFFEYGLRSYFGGQDIDFSGDKTTEHTKYFQEITVKDFSDSLVKTYNVVGYLPARIETNNTVVIGAHFDNVYSVKINGSEIQSHGAYDNGTGVATMLAIIAELQGQTFDFNIVFSAFTAEENGMHGSEEFLIAMQTQKPKHLENLLLMYNLDSVGAGDYLYLYSEEVEQEHERFIRDIAKELNIELKSPPMDKRLILVGSYYNNIPYTHVGMMSDHARFYNRGKNTAFFFTMNWDSFKKEGVVESDSYPAIMHTSNDTLATLKANYGSTYSKYMANAANIILASFEKNDVFVSAMQDSYANRVNYGFWTNPLWATLISLGLLLIFMTIVILVYYKIKKKAPTYQPPIIKIIQAPDNVFVFGKEFETNKPDIKEDDNDPFGL